MKTKSNDSKRILARAREEPDLDALRAELDCVLAQAGNIRERQETAGRIRFCEWEGQSEDFRKHADDLGEEATPFEGAADSRPFQADKIINERVALVVEALMAGEIQSTPIGDLAAAENAVKATRLLRFMRGVEIAGEMRDEAELLANYQEGDDPGIGILKIYWKRELALEMRQLGLDDVGRALLSIRGIELPESGELPREVQGAVDDVGDLMFNPLRTDEAIDMLTAAYPSVTKRNIKRAFRELQRTGSAALPVPYEKESRVCISALRYMEDVFFLSDVDDIQRAPGLYEVLRLTEQELLAENLNSGWGQDFIDAVIEAGPGPSGIDPLSDANVQRDLVTGGERNVDNLYEVWLANTRAVDGFGIAGVYLTVFSHKVPDVYGKHELLDYPHGDYPYVLFRREKTGRGVNKSRGVTQIAGAAQHEIKVQRDCRTDYTQISTVPPVKVRERRGGLEMLLGPMVEVPVRDQDDVTWMQPPPFPQMSIEVEKATKNDLNEYFGRMVPEVPPELRQALLQKMVNGWLNNWKKAFDQALKLMQEYMSPTTLSMVAGGPLQELSREEIRGSFRTMLAFNVNDLNLEFVMKRLDAVGRVLAWDQEGLADRSMLMRVGFRGIDPTLAEVGLRSEESASRREVTAEQDLIARMAVGIPAQDFKEGVNARLRLRVLEQTIQSSPQLSRKINQPTAPDDQMFGELYKRHRQNLEFLVSQNDNRETGKTGVKPMALGAPAA